MKIQVKMVWLLFIFDINTAFVFTYLRRIFQPLTYIFLEMITKMIYLAIWLDNNTDLFGAIFFEFGQRVFTSLCKRGHILAIFSLAIKPIKKTSY